MTVKQEKHKRKIKERGITLIALVITIIVLLILAGVALSALTGDSGILNNAESAKDKTNLANAEEQVALAVQGALTRGYADGIGIITRGNLKLELDRIVGQDGKDYALIGDESPWKVTIGEYKVQVYENGRISKILPSAEGTTPWLPLGFSQVKGTSLETGLTISNTTDGTLGTQNYVWIEVPTTISAEVIRNETPTTITLADAENEDEILEVLEIYAGKGTATSYRDNSFKDEWYDSKEKTKDEGGNLNDTAGCGMTYYEYEERYNKMLNSIKKYGGFWLAQYEAGIAYEKEGETSTYRTKDSERIINPTSANYAKNQYPYNCVTCSEAQKIANEDSTNSYTSSLPFGIQWDLVCKFLEVKKAKTYKEIAQNSDWGNYKNIQWISSADSKYMIVEENTFTAGSKEKSSGEYIVLTTGAIETTKDGQQVSAMNIYDLAGNACEFTLEHAVVTSYGPCTLRGKDAYNYESSNSPVAKRVFTIVSQNGLVVGFRSVLY